MVRIKSTDRIAGVGVLDIRRLMRLVRDNAFSYGRVSEVLAISKPAAQALVDELVERGYAKRVTMMSKEVPAFETTLSGNASALATAARPVHRATAERVLGELLERVAAVNSDEYFLYKVDEVLVFGSYLAGNDRLRDVDIALKLVPSTADPAMFHRLCQTRVSEACAAGRAFSNMSRRVILATVRGTAILEKALPHAQPARG